MPELPNSRPFDPTAIEFPTDRITIGQMRNGEPLMFEYGPLIKIGANKIEAIAAHCLELTLAEKAYCRARHLPDPHPSTDIQCDIIPALNHTYTRYGISTGLQETRQIVRRIQIAAARQAGTRLGHAR